MESDALPEADPLAGPMSPTQAEWDALSPAEREGWRARLGPMPFEAQPPIGDPHIDAERIVEDALGGWFGRRSAKAYIGRGLTVYYPAERRFAPDLFVVFDVEPGPRTSWIVAHERRGLDFVLEIHFAGDRHKDMVENVQRYARLGIPEYFIYDVRTSTIRGYVLGPERGRYIPVLAQRGRWLAPRLGLELGLVDGRLRFWAEGNLLPLREEIADQLARALDTALANAEAERAAEAARADAEAARADAAIARADAETARADALARELAALRARLGET